ncbi:hypothetical protein B0H13DRAFT_1855461 [Mycena leptocephala]|nr:hypothetical protein B0H13DRAFT_1855461 [Mycena leptocephala]
MAILEPRRSAMKAARPRILAHSHPRQPAHLRLDTYEILAANKNQHLGQKYLMESCRKRDTSCPTAALTVVSWRASCLNILPRSVMRLDNCEILATDKNQRLGQEHLMGTCRKRDTRALWFRGAPAVPAVPWLFIKFIARSAVRGGAVVPRPVTVGSVHPAHHVADLLARDATEEPGELREVALDEGTARQGEGGGGEESGGRVGGRHEVGGAIRGMGAVGSAVRETGVVKVRAGGRIGGGSMCGGWRQEREIEREKEDSEAEVEALWVLGFNTKSGQTLGDPANPAIMLI